MKLWVGLILGLSLIACGDNTKEEINSNPYWKSANEYCYYFSVDPSQGSGGKKQGWSDTKPEISSNGNYVAISIINVRLDESRYTDDYFLPKFEQVMNSGDGYFEIHENCK